MAVLASPPRIFFMLIELTADATLNHQHAVIAAARAANLMARPLPPTVSHLTAADAAAVARAPKTQQAQDEPRLQVALGALTLEAELRQQFLAMPCVHAVHAMPGQAPLCRRVGNEPTTVVFVGGVPVGGPEVVMMAGPCAVESLEQLMLCAHGARRAGARILRGGAFKPRSNPYAFMGLEGQGLEMFAEVKRATGLAVVTEVMAVDDIEAVSAVADALQVGARNMQNYPLLRALGRQPLPVLLKRGLCATYEEWLAAAEYIYVHGNGRIILCERGIRTFESHTRNTLDLAAVPVMAELCHLPMVVDPSHGTGARAWVPAMARAALAAGADGLMIEAHPDPARARSDGPQSLTLPMLEALGASLAPIARAVGRSYPSKESDP